MPADRPDVSVIIISYNTRQLTLDCLRSLYDDLTDTRAEVWVVDNDSTDDSCDAVHRAFPQVRLVRNDRNVGFGAANNIAMSRATGRCFLLLNSDAFVQRGALSTLVRDLNDHPKVGVVGTRLLNADGSLQVSCYRFPTPGRAWLENLWLSKAFNRQRWIGDYSAWAHDVERSVDWVIGACMLVRREVFEEVGGFDESFFMYAEEADWQRRIRDAGWDVVFTPAATVTHLGGASGAAEPARINRHFFESLDHYQRKHHGLAGLFWLRLAMVVGCGLRAVLWMIALVVSPARRSVAPRKVRLHCWLCVRQATRWRLSRPKAVGA